MNFGFSQNLFYQVSKRKLPVNTPWRVSVVTQGAKMKLAFNIPMHCEFGQSVGLLGANKELGGWDLSQIQRLTWSDGDVWRLQINIDRRSDLVLQYKYVVVNPEGDVAIWKPGPDVEIKLLELLQGHTSPSALYIHDYWDGACQEIEVEIGSPGSSMDEIETPDEQVVNEPPPPPPPLDAPVAEIPAHVDIQDVSMSDLEDMSDVNDVEVGEAEEMDVEVAMAAPWEDRTEESLAAFMDRVDSPWNYEREGEVYRKAVKRAFQDLDNALASSVELRASDGYKPASQQMVEADKAIAAAAHRATAVLQVRDATSPPEVLALMDQPHPDPMTERQRRKKPPPKPDAAHYE